MLGVKRDSKREIMDRIRVICGPREKDSDYPSCADPQAAFCLLVHYLMGDDYGFVDYTSSWQWNTQALYDVMMKYRTSVFGRRI